MIIKLQLNFSKIYLLEGITNKYSRSFGIFDVDVAAGGLQDTHKEFTFLEKWKEKSTNCFSGRITGQSWRTTARFAPTNVKTSETNFTINFVLRARS